MQLVRPPRSGKEKPHPQIYPLKPREGGWTQMNTDEETKKFFATTRCGSSMDVMDKVDEMDDVEK